jgi:hypothetical protein
LAIKIITVHFIHGYYRMDENLQPQNKYFEKKEQKEEVAKQVKQKKAMNGVLKWVVFIAVIGVVAWWGRSYFNTITAPAPGDNFSAQSREHIGLGDDHPEYNSNPPTGGWHYSQPAQTGIYDIELPDETLVHNLEHSHIWIAYHPDLSPDQIEQLAKIAKDYGSKIIMTLRPANDTMIAIVAWEHLLKMDSIDEVQIRAFIGAYRGIAGPEKIPDSGFDDFRGRNE